jgi:hypothetical protein
VSSGGGAGARASRHAVEAAARADGAESGEVGETEAKSGARSVAESATDGKAIAESGLETLDIEANLSGTVREWRLAERKIKCVRGAENGAEMREAER